MNTGQQLVEALSKIGELERENAALSDEVVMAAKRSATLREAAKDACDWHEQQAMTHCTITALRAVLDSYR